MDNLGFCINYFSGLCWTIVFTVFVLGFVYYQLELEIKFWYGKLKGRFKK